MDEYTIGCDHKNGNILNKYAVQGEFRKYDGWELLKHALHNTMSDFTKARKSSTPSQEKNAPSKCVMERKLNNLAP